MNLLKGKQFIVLKDKIELNRNLEKGRKRGRLIEIEGGETSSDFEREGVGVNESMYDWVTVSYQLFRLII